MQIWYELQQVGERGYTLDELVEKVKPRVPAGYAWRRYLGHRRSKIRSRTKGLSSDSIIADTPGNRAQAVRYVVNDSLVSMVRCRTAIRRPDQRYAVGVRKPKSVFTDEQHDFDGSISRKHVADMQLMRVLTGPNGVIEAIAAVRASPQKKHLPAISVPLAAALERWVEAHATSTPR
jgi:hypothetical protein